MRKNLLVIVLCTVIAISLSNCVGILVVRQNIQQLEDNDAKISGQLAEGIYTTPDTIPKLDDSLAYYKTFAKSYYSVHRFFYKRAAISDSLHTGFNIIVVRFNNGTGWTERQDNVMQMESKLGTPVKDWQTRLNLLATLEPYQDISDDGLRLRTAIRSIKF